MTDYRQFRLSKLNDPTFSHLKLLLYWPIYGLVFPDPGARFLHLDYHTIYTPLDDLVPFLRILPLSLPVLVRLPHRHAPVPAAV